MKEPHDKENDSKQFRTPPLSSGDIGPGVSNGAGLYSDASVAAPVYPQRPYNDAQGTPLKFGLIRGYHRQMYVTPSAGDPPELDTTCCASRPPTGLKQVHPLDRINWGVAFGCILLILGIIAILIGFLMPQKAYESSHPTYLTPRERNEMQTFSLFIDIFVIAGLSVLSIGGLVVSVALLFPLIRRRRRAYVYRHQDEPIHFFGNEVYVKADENGSKELSKTESKQAITLGFLRDFEPGDVFLRKVQPTGKTESEPNDVSMTTKTS